MAEAAPSNPSIEQRIAAAITPEEPVAEQPVEQPVEQPAEQPAELSLVEGDEPVSEEAEPLGEDAEPVSEEAASEEPVTLTTLGDVAELIGIDPGEMYNLSIPVTDADGNRSEVSLSEWKDSYQHSQRAERAAREAAELREVLQAEKQQIAEAAERQAHETASYLQAAEQQLTADFNGVDWDALRASNPTEWAARRQEMQERHSVLQNVRRQASEAYDNHRAQQAEVQQQELAKLIEREQHSLLAAIPEWKDEGKRRTEQAAMRDYLLDNGYSSLEVDQAYDHRAIVMANKARLYDEMKKQGDVAKKKVVKIGKTVLKPGAKRDKAEAKHDAEAALKARLRKSGHTDDAAALIAHRLGR